MHDGAGLTPTSVRLMHRVLYALALPPAVVAVFVLVGPGEANPFGAFVVAVMLAVPLLTIWSSQ